MAEGHGYMLYHGLPSGIKATSLFHFWVINLFSLCNCAKSFNLKKFLYVVGGDDFLVLINKLDFKERNRIKKEMLDKAVEFGMKFKFLKTKNAGIGRNVRFFSTFYKYTIFDGFTITKPEIIYEKMPIPWNKKYNSPYGLLYFLFNLLCSIGKPATTVLLKSLYLSRYKAFVTGSIL
jgi:hypothetical protein